MNLEQIKKLDLQALQQNPRRHLEVLSHFRDIVKERILGLEDPEWRAEFEFLLERTELKMKEVRTAIHLDDMMNR